MLPDPQTLEEFFEKFMAGKGGANRFCGAHLSGNFNNQCIEKLVGNRMQCKPK
jgi:hypothetical protein